MFNIALFVGKFFIFLVNTFHIGRGSTWTGELALTFDKHFIRHILAKNPSVKTIVVTGTNGKTTTAKLVTHALEKNGTNVATNASGANLVNGIASVLAFNSSLSGKLKSDSFVFEVDENAVTPLLKELSPNAVVVLNLFRDQLDRYGEINSISTKWLNAFSHLDKKTTLILNGNDPEILNLGRNTTNVKVQYFGLDKRLMTIKKIDRDADQVLCPNCLTRLNFTRIAYSHIGDFTCPKCDLKPEKLFILSEKVESSLIGLFNRSNLTAAVLTLETVWGVQNDQINHLLKDFKPSFGRQESLNIKGKKVLIQLAKNPAGFNQAFSVLDNLQGDITVVVLLNNRIPDGRDTSWIWDVNFQPVIENAHRIFVSGDRALDMALRLKYQSGRDLEFKKVGELVLAENICASTNLSLVINKAIEETGSNGTVVIFPTYSAMLETRKILTGGKW